MSLLALVATACNPHTSQPACRADPLREAAAALAGTSGGEAQRIAAAAILDACAADGFSPEQREELELRAGRRDPADRSRVSLEATVRMWSSVCPRFADFQRGPKVPKELLPLHFYDMCGWQSLELVARDEVTTDLAVGEVWSIHPRLRSLGVPHVLARPLMRALILGPPPYEAAWRD